jgi:hypothetical protein
MFHAVFRLEDIWSKRVGARDTPDIDSCSTMRLQDVRHGADSCGCGDDIIDNGDMPMTDLGNLTASHKDAPHILAPLGGIPVLRRTLGEFQACAEVDEIIVVTGEDVAEQIEHWRDLMNIATSWIKTLQTSLPTLRPDGVAIVGNARFTLDSFASQQRLVSVVLEFQLATNTSCASYVDFPSSVPPDFTWPPKDVVTGNWVKGEQTYTAHTSTTLTWTANTYELTDAWIVNVYQNGQRLLESQYDITSTGIELNVLTHYDGATYYILALWTV